MKRLGLGLSVAMLAAGLIGLTIGLTGCGKSDSASQVPPEVSSQSASPGAGSAQSPVNGGNGSPGNGSVGNGPSGTGSAANGSSGAGSSAVASRATAAPASVDPATFGTIAGVVKFTGTPPVMETIDAQTGLPDAPPIKQETIIVNPNATLKNVIVYLKPVSGNLPPNDAPAASALPPAVLDQKFCRYVPHVIALRVGQTLTVKSEDATMHNVHMMCMSNTQQNMAMTEPGQSQDITFASPEIFQTKCDIHPWMSAWIGVFDHPYFAVTGDDGSFAIPHVPPGNYKIAAWHETLPEQDADVTVKSGGKTEADFTFAAP